MLADTLKKLRQENNVGQKELAQALKTSLKTISHWETGYSEPSIVQLIALADYFEITIDELVNRNELKN